MLRQPPDFVYPSGTIFMIFSLRLVFSKSLPTLLFFFFDFCCYLFAVWINVLSVFFQILTLLQVFTLPHSMKASSFPVFVVSSRRSNLAFCQVPIAFQSLFVSCYSVEFLSDVFSKTWRLPVLQHGFRVPEEEVDEFQKVAMNCRLMGDPKVTFFSLTTRVGFCTWWWSE